MSANAAAVYSRVRWRLLPFLLACYVAAFLDRNNIGFAKLDFMRDLSMSESAYGFAAGVFYAGYILFEIPSNLWLARIGARKTITRILVLWGAATMATAFVTTAGQLTAMRFVLGAAEAGFFPGVLLYLTYWVPRGQRARFTSIFMLGIPLSGIIGSPISGSIMRAFANSETLKSWQALFILEGLPAIALGIIGYLTLKDSPNQAAWLRPEERHLILRDLEAERNTGKAVTHKAFGAALRDLRFYLLTLMAFALFSASAGFFFWLPSMLAKVGIKDVFHIGLIGAIPFSVAAACQVLVARHSDRTGERRWHTAAPALVGAAGWILLAVGPAQPVYAVAMLTVAAAGSFAAMPSFWTIPPDFLSGTAAAGGIALISTLGALGGFVSPTVIGWIVGRFGGLAYGQIYLAVLLAGSAAVLLAILPSKTRAA
jgi:MFS family permease